MRSVWKGSVFVCIDICVWERKVIHLDFTTVNALLLPNGRSKALFMRRLQRGGFSYFFPVLSAIVVNC